MFLALVDTTRSFPRKETTITHSNSPLTYTERAQDGGKKIPLYVFGLLQIPRWCMDGGNGGQFATDTFIQKI